MSEVIDFGEVLEFAPAPALMHKPGFAPREYQIDCRQSIRTGWPQASRQLVVMAGGCGKTVIFSGVAHEEVDAGGRVLILAHTDELLEQAIDKLYRSTGLEADKEKAEDHASLHAMVVVGSIQTLTKDRRLLGFPDDHFALVVCDEAHRALSPSYVKVLHYFHYGAASLAEDFVPPPAGAYTPKARLLGVTATASRGDKKSLGEMFERVAFEYGLLEACRDGYLVRPVVENIPLKIDLRGIKLSRSGGQGADLDLGEVTARIAPLLREIAKALAHRARDLKTVVFTPSVETARLLSEALLHEGMNASFVSGACANREAKIEDFRAAGRGSILCNALLVVEGFDVPDITGVCILRATRIWSFYVQACVRGTRTLPGVIDGLDTREERLAAIAASAKTKFTIFDFLWLSDRIDLVKPVDLVATKAGVKERMDAAAAAGQTDLLEMEAGAERDLLKSLEKAIKANARKEARVIDPIAWAVSLGDAALATWEPETKWDSDPATPGQLNFLRGQGIDVTNIKFKGLASKILTRVMERMKHKLATPRQLEFMKQLGIPEDKANLLTMTEANAAIDATLAEKKARRAAMVPQA